MSVRFEPSEEQRGSEAWDEWCSGVEIPEPRRVISIHRGLDSGWSVRANSPRSPRSPGSSAGASSRAAQWLDGGLEALR
eukprot:866255-Alexandrium_andersonii.AAC.1